MKHYVIKEFFRSKVNDFCSELFTSRNSYFKRPKELLKELYSQYQTGPSFPGLPTDRVLSYIEIISQNYDAIIRANNTEMLHWINVFEQIVPNKNIPHVLYNDIIAAMRYEDLREKEYLHFLKEMEINTCVYCHAQLIVIIEISYYKRSEGSFNLGDVKDMRGILELDHRYPTSQYPYLCTSFYNLYPICAYCNKIKSNNHTGFELYKEDNSPEMLYFQLNDYDVIKKQLGALTIDEIQINIEINDKAYNRQEIETFLDIFKIKQIYNTQKDIIEELLLKKEIYTPQYIQELTNNFSNLLSDAGIIKRVILGNYYKPEDVWKRPMAKFMQDIARNISLID